ncbi:formate dehydrogenase subunit gamma [Verminephrobacter aporrectodeae subsp. tuberculatae]|uniref:formate dehydrogenase subunit gamma n=1 Tax=Verminephrobacter aporrectodeae TaxID=1110389 RepID=UPI0002377E66|nr:formate dehydrogenase subunit gamma [Verminephrobacter aporrectodeae]MCW8165921.1 formate dehydrogenase subunit gamma [Verminephrobacter aporrectodeae subsp. tuberculatae]MCW8169944.1 formate dehydrogenase subunit gamma [Verminephrobacter aporrectodeae subsp. tuberculatae]
MKQRMRFLTLVAALAWWGPAAVAASDAAAAAPQAPVGVQSQNIFQLGPDAETDPGYAAQTQAERARVQPGNNAPLWRQVGQGVTGYSSLPKSQAPEAGNLIQPTVQYPGSRVTNAGQAWRQVRNDWIIPYGAALLAIVLLALLIFYCTKGPLGRDHAETGARGIERFTPFERAAHWANAIAFCALAVSGITMAFGKFLLLPILGATLFGWLAYALKNVHNFMGPLFAVSLLVVVLTFVKDNIANRADWLWLSKGGGMLGGGDQEVPSHRFNAGEKGLFWWGVTLPGIIVVLTGLVLDRLIPGWGDVRGEMHVAHMLHATLALWMMALICGHIYMGTVGMRGAYRAMKTGYVSEGWAREHHALWYADVQAGKIPRQRSASPPAGAAAGATPSAGQPAQV